LVRHKGLDRTLQANGTCREFRDRLNASYLTTDTWAALDNAPYPYALLSSAHFFVTMTDSIESTESNSHIVERYGRPYQEVEGCVYVLPTDLAEVNRLDVQHHAIQAVTGRYFHAPLNNPKRIVDLGTGTGIWIRELAKMFPESELLGVDVSPLPEGTQLPDNCKFEIVNVLAGLPQEDGYFDFVRQRLLTLGMPKASWQSHIVECARVCASNGWVEYIESDIQLYNGGDASERFNTFMLETVAARGVDLNMAKEIGDLMKEAGLQDVQSEEYMIPTGTWAGEIGKIFWENYAAGVRGVKPFIIAKFGISEEEFDETLKVAEEEMNTKQGYMRVFVHYGRKP
jgi:ubiquinone/menaquinone biosynthesis C-methylase UbiE